MAGMKQEYLGGAKKLMISSLTLALEKPGV